MEFFIKTCLGVLLLGYCNILIAISSFYSSQVEEFKELHCFNKFAGRIVSFNIDKRASTDKVVQGYRRFPKRINPNAYLLEYKSSLKLK